MAWSDFMFTPDGMPTQETLPAIYPGAEVQEPPTSVPASVMDGVSGVADWFNKNLGGILDTYVKVETLGVQRDVAAMQFANGGRQYYRAPNGQLMPVGSSVPAGQQGGLSDRGLLLLLLIGGAVMLMRGKG